MKYFLLFVFLVFTSMEGLAQREYTTLVRKAIDNFEEAAKFYDSKQNELLVAPVNPS